MRLLTMYFLVRTYFDLSAAPKTIAQTIEKWQQAVIGEVLADYSNANAEAHNRATKLIARTARLGTTNGSHDSHGKPPARPNRSHSK